MTDQGLPQATPSRPGSGDNPADSIPERARDEQANLRNNERQRKLADDTAKLLALATELKEQVDKTNKNILSVDVIKKADEIEKLAKSVKERMRGSGI
jgi:HAMP domain-containing protein